MAVVSGDPAQAQPFEVQLSLFLVGMGDRFDLKKTKTMKKGAQGSVPANQHHFAMARGKTVVDVKSMGPFAMTYVNAADDPQKKQATP